ncbi:MAG: PAS domain S-box protein [Spirochaetes bacterium]|nr:PAS domain S-box protein [Spirochaetota bacterium]
MNWPQPLLHSPPGSLWLWLTGFVAIALLAYAFHRALQRRRTAEWARHSQRVFSAAFQNSPVLMAISRGEGGALLEANERFLAVFGYGKEELLGRTILELGLIPDPAAREAILEVLRERGRVSGFELPLATKSGQRLWGSFSAQAIELAGEPCLLIVLSDITERKRIEEALRESEARFRTLADHTTDLIACFSLDHRLLYASPAALRFMGRQAEDVLGRTAAEMGMGFDDLGLNEGALRHARETGEPHQVDFSVRRGELTRHFNWRLVPEFDAGGRLVSILTTARDITDLRRREGDLDFQRRLMQSLAVFQNKLFLQDEMGILRLTLEFIARFVPVARAIVLGPQGLARRYTLVGGAFTAGELPVESLEGMLQKRIMDHREPMSVDEVDREAGLHPAERQSALKDGVRSFFAIPIVFEDLCLGLLYAGDREAAGVPQDLRNIMPLLSSIAGIALKKAQLYDEARHNEAWYRTLLENAPDGLVIFDLCACRILEINAQALALFGLPAGEGADLPPPGSPPSGLDRFLAEHYERFVLEPRDRFESRILHSGGRSIPCEVRTVHLPPEPGLVVRISLADASERERAEAARQRQAQGLMQADKLLALGELAAGLAHEITQPLSGIALASQLLLKQAESGAMEPERFAKKLHDIGTYVDRVRHLIEHVRTFSRERRDDGRGLFDLRESVRRAVSLTGTQYENHQISLEVDCGERPLAVRGNAYALEQVVLNLLSNAKYAVEKRAQAEGDGFRRSISVKTLAVGGDRQLEVLDNGTGIPEAVRHRLFEPFFTTKPVNEGTGLGLSVSYGIVKNMGGEIRLESREGEYTRVVVSFPGPDPHDGERSP